MPCPKCQVKADYHNFLKFASINETTLFYTSPAKTDDFNEDGTKLANFKIHIQEETTGKPWIWVVDCGKMEYKHFTEFSFNMGLFDLLSKDPNLEAVWIIRSNTWINTIISFLRTISSARFIHNIRYFDQTGMELYEALKKTSLDDSAIHWLIAQ